MSSPKYCIPLLLLFTLLVSCEDDSNTRPIEGLPSTFEVLANSEDHVIFSNLVEQMGLVEFLDEGTYTVFAPFDFAFDGVDTNSYSDEELTNFLLNHVIQGNASSGDLSNRYLDSQATVTIDERESNISLLVNVTTGVFLNGNSQVIEADIEAANGTVHVVDELIEVANLRKFIEEDPDFAFLKAALTREDQPDFLDILSTSLGNEPTPITLFAPTNEAFETAFVLLGVDDLEEIEGELLTEILNLHIITQASLREIDFTEEIIETLGGSLSFNVENNFIEDPNGRPIEFSTQDVQTTNGVIHVINDVILPEMELEDPIDDVEQVNFTLENEADIAYFVSEITGDETVTELSENNSTWTLTQGTRYTINVVNASTHPLELRNQFDETLLGQSVDGTLANNPDIDFITVGTTMSFTLTPELANQLSSYVCSNHPAMKGDIIVNQ